MNSLLLLVPISLLLLGIAIGLFVWAVRKGQYDDLDTPALDILREDPMDPQHPRNRASGAPVDHRENPSADHAD